VAEMMKVLLSLLAVFLIAGCDSKTPMQTTVTKIQENMGYYRNRTVQVEGVVAPSVPWDLGELTGPRPSITDVRIDFRALNQLKDFNVASCAQLEVEIIAVIKTVIDVNNRKLAVLTDISLIRPLDENNINSGCYFVSGQNGVVVN
jgi:hypothetical protein